MGRQGNISDGPPDMRPGHYRVRRDAATRFAEGTHAPTSQLVRIFPANASRKAPIRLGRMGRHSLPGEKFQSLSDGSEPRSTRVASMDARMAHRFAAKRISARTCLRGASERPGLGLASAPGWTRASAWRETGDIPVTTRTPRGGTLHAARVRIMPARRSGRSLCGRFRRPVAF